MYFFGGRDIEHSMELFLRLSYVIAPFNRHLFRQPIQNLRQPKENVFLTFR